MTVTDITPIPKIWKKYKKGMDLEMHVAFTKVDGVEFVELRDWIVSKGEYGKGYLFPSQMLEQVLETLTDMAGYNGTSNSRPGAGQGALPGV